MAWISAFERASLPSLLSQHARRIASLRDELGEVEDDVWLLRYVLSFESRPAEAAEAARKALQWREEHRGLVEAAKARSLPPGLSMEDVRALQTMLVSGFHYTTSFGDPIFIIRSGQSNQSPLLDMLGEDKVELWLTYLSECAWQYCEVATRKKRYFVKQISLQDFASATLTQDRRFFRVLGKTSKANEWLRPQLLGRALFFNTPAWMSLAFSIASNFMSKKTLSKIWVHRQTIGLAGGRLCPYAQELLGGADQLPTFFGGACKCEEHGGCVSGMANTFFGKHQVDDITRSPGQILALLRLPALEEVEESPHTPDEAASGQACQASCQSEVAPIPSIPCWRRCWRRCCHKRRPLAASVDAV